MTFESEVVWRPLYLPLEKEGTPRIHAVSQPAGVLQ
jgi:hypothetical protein